MTKLDEMFKSGFDGGIDLKLTSRDTMDLLDVLNFTYDTLLFFIREEKAKGSKVATVKLEQYFVAAESLLVKVHSSIDMVGVPNMEERH